MRIYFSLSNNGLYRMNHFVNTLKVLGKEIIILNDISSQQFSYSDIWFVDIENRGDRYAFFESNEKIFLDFHGKLIFYSLDDLGENIRHIFINKNLLERIDCFVLGNLHPSYALFEIYDKSVLIPRFISEYREWYDNFNIVRDRNIIFYGMASSIIRIKAMEILKSFGNSFIGDITTNRHMEEIRNNHYKGNFWNIDEVEYFSPENYTKLLTTSLVSFCPPGNTNWTYRHIESMAAGCSIISCNLSQSCDWDFLYKNEVEQLFFYIDNNLKNLKEICEYCLDNYDICIEKGREGYEVYQKYFSLTRKQTYNDLVWENVMNQFFRLGVNLGE